MWNPLNWFSGSSGDPVAQIFGTQPAQLPAPSYQPSSYVYTPDYSPNFYTPDYSTQYSPIDYAAPDNPYGTWASNDFNGPPPAYTDTYLHY